MKSWMHSSAASLNWLCVILDSICQPGPDDVSEYWCPAVIWLSNRCRNKHESFRILQETFSAVYLWLPVKKKKKKSGCFHWSCGCLQGVFNSCNTQTAISLLSKRTNPQMRFRIILSCKWITSYSIDESGGLCLPANCNVRTHPSWWFLGRM